MKQPEGIIVSEMAAKGPAEKAGLRVGDVILKVNGEKIKSGEDVLAMMVDMSPGDTLNLTIYRERKNLELQLVLERAPGEKNE